MMTPERSSDEVVRHARELREKQIQDCSRGAEQMIAAKMKAGKPSRDAIARLIAEEFDELNP